jgi:hypothetical protein
MGVAMAAAVVAKKYGDKIRMLGLKISDLLMVSVDFRGTESEIWYISKICQRCHIRHTA